MIWHIVTFDMSNIDEQIRSDIEARLARLADLDCVTWLTIGRDIDQPASTSLVSLFASYEDLETYRHHPEHVPVVEAVKGNGIAISRADIEGSLPPEAT